MSLAAISSSQVTARLLFTSPMRPRENPAICGSCAAILLRQRGIRRAARNSSSEVLYIVKQHSRTRYFGHRRLTATGSRGSSPNIAICTVPAIRRLGSPHENWDSPWAVSAKRHDVSSPALPRCLPIPTEIQSAGLASAMHQRRFTRRILRHRSPARNGPEATGKPVAPGDRRG